MLFSSLVSYLDFRGGCQKQLLQRRSREENRTIGICKLNAEVSVLIGVCPPEWSRFGNSSEDKTSACLVFIHLEYKIPWQAKLGVTFFLYTLENSSLEWEPTKLRISLVIHLFYQCWENTLRILLSTEIRSLKCCYFDVIYSSLWKKSLGNDGLK